MSSAEIKKKIFAIRTDQEFGQLCLEIFRYQSKENKVYKNYLAQLQIDADAVSSLSEIPFLPVEFFKYFEVITGAQKSKIIFTSSGTTGAEQSRHYVSEPTLYEQSFRRCFGLFYGDIKEYCLLALLPSYLERERSSLIYMVQDLIAESKNKKGGFYLNNIDDLHASLIKLKEEHKTKTLLLGVTYALLDFVELYKLNFPELIVMETGGMKGKRKEMVRNELHAILCNGFGVNQIHSEYGMTEMLSQAYSKGDGAFHAPWMRVLIRDANDPLKMLGENQTGGINIIDLANINSCCFLATQDLGKVYADKSFEVIGRFDNSDIRGCNLLVS